MNGRKLMSPSKVAIYGVTIALVAAMTAISVPIPATQGFFNFGEVIIFFAAFAFGRKEAAICGAIGAALVDALYAQHFIIATLVAKSLEGFIAGTIANYLRKARRQWGVRTVAYWSGGILMILTYFCWVAFVLPLGLYPDFISSGGVSKAIIELPWNVFQVFIGGLIAIFLVEGIERSYPQIANFRS